MPIIEYQCKECSTKYDFLHKSINNIEDVSCPECNSSNSKRLLSTFSSTMESSSSTPSCETGSCGMQAPAGGCASGLCGLN